MNLQHLYFLCTQLQSITSTKEKQQFLIDNRCDDLDELLRFLLDPSVTTGVDRKKLNKKASTYVGEPYVELSCMLKYIKEHNTGRDVDVAYCQLCMNTYPEYSNFIADILTKTLRLGVNTKLVNKAYGKDFIHVHEVQLGSPRDKLRLKDGEWFSLSQKMNGVRCTYVNGKMISRQGKEFKGLEHIANFLKETNMGTNFVYDGELIRKNTDGISDNENFRLTTSLVNGEDGDKKQLEFVVFDALPMEEFYNGKSTIEYLGRRLIVDGICNIANIQGVNVRPVEIVYQGTDQSEIKKQLVLADARGWEGLMLNKNLPYECKRTTSLIKVKSFKHSDLRILDCLEGDGKYKGVLGSFVVQYKDNTVNVGSGFSDQQRVDYWTNRENLIGKICQVKYKEVSRDKNTGLESLQFPVFEMLRLDKKEDSYE